MILGVPREIKQDEFRVAMTPSGVHQLAQDGHTLLVESGAGSGSGFPDEEYAEAGATIVGTADEVFLAVRGDVPAISLATVYKSLETLVGCGLAVKLKYTDHSARYDRRTDPHHHARSVFCGSALDLAG